MDKCQTICPSRRSRFVLPLVWKRPMLCRHVMSRDTQWAWVTCGRTVKGLYAVKKAETISGFPLKSFSNVQNLTCYPFSVVFLCHLSDFGFTVWRVHNKERSCDLLCSAVKHTGSGRARKNGNTLWIYFCSFFMFFRLFVFVKFPTLLPQSSATKAQTQAIGMTQVETKSHMQTQVQAKSSGEPSKLFRPEVIWIQCSKYPCACVMPEQYFVFTCCSANTSIRPSKKKRKEKIVH